MHLLEVTFGVVVIGEIKLTLLLSLLRSHQIVYGGLLNACFSPCAANPRMCLYRRTRSLRD